MGFWTYQGRALRCLLASTGVGAGFVHNGAVAYEVSTHETLTLRSMAMADAFDANTGVINDLALDARTLLPDDSGVRRTIEGLLAHGAQWEDLREGETNCVFHFLDPQHNGRGLAVPLLLSASSSLQWAVEDRGSDSRRGTVGNPHSYIDAQRYFLDGLTHQTAESRERYLGLTFQSLGHVAHHLQDMAQPSHVRNDSHFSKFGIPPDLHHAWTAAQGATLSTGGYPKPRITELAQLWTNAGTGIADFTSHNFVSPDSNFTAGSSGFTADPEYPNPVPDNARIEKVTLQSLLGREIPLVGQAQVWFIGNAVTDAAQPELSGFNQRASSSSIFNEDLSGFGMFSRVSFNRFNAAAANDWLLPRAVAYGAALFDYFFRARMQIVASTFTDTAVNLTVRNASNEGIVWKGQLPEQGDGFEWALYYDKAGGLRSRLALSNDDLGNGTLRPGDTYELSFSLPADFDRRSSTPFTLVFNGVAGTEPAISALAFGPVEAAFVVSPDYLPVDGIAGGRVIHRNGSAWELTQERDRVAGNVDWKGHNVGDTLSWMGPSSRYFGVGQPTTAVYRRGAVLTRAPAPVVGAAITAAGAPRQLLVATSSSGLLSIYARPLAASYANDGMYDAETNPDGWRRIYAGGYAGLRSPVFFNASGTQAQAMTVGSERLKLTLNGDTVGVERIGATGRGHELRAGRTNTLSTTQGNDICGGRPYYGECNGDVGKYNAGYEQTAFENHTVSTIEEQPVVVCADYRGDQEVLCTYSFGVLSDFVRDSIASRDGKYGYVCSTRAVTSGGVTGRSRMTEVHDHDVVRSLRVGSIEIPLRGQHRLATNSSQVSWFWPGVPAGMSAQYVWDDVTTDYDGRILFLDARADVALYASRTVTRSTVGSESATEFVGDVFGEIGAGWFAPEVTKRREERELVAITPHGRVSTPVGEATEAQSPQRIGQSFAGNFAYPWWSATCATDPSATNQSSYRTQPVAVERDDADFWPHTYSGNDVSVAVSRDGHVVMSAPLLQISSDGGSSSLGRWNYLSGGRLPAIIPGASAEPDYRPVGLVE